MQQQEITVAVDGTGGDRGTANIVNAVRFALALYPKLKLIVFGPSNLEEDLARGRLDMKRVQFVNAAQCIPQDAPVKDVLERYSRSSMRLAVQAVKDGEAQAVVSAGGTGPLVILSRHILGEVSSLRPALCARMPSGPGRFTLMLDLGANAQSTPSDLYDFARLGQAAARINLGIGSPRIRLLNVGTEAGKGSHLVQQARELMEQDKDLGFEGFIEANRIFAGDCDVIVTDGFTGNVALKAAEGVASIFARAPGIKRFFAKLARPEWLLPWQYNGSVLLGVNGVVVKSHASAGDEAMAVAMVEAAKCVQAGLTEALPDELGHRAD